ncbi:MAG: 8-amino-7-oxononanoate synthase, partial [bacterium]
MRRAETWIEDALAEFNRQGLGRHLSTYQNTGTELSDGTRSLVNFSSNDYLGLARHPRVIAAAGKAMERYGAGATASRLVVGSLP